MKTSSENKRGSAVKKNSNETSSKTINVSLRAPRDLIERVDALLENQPIPMSRNVWILKLVLDELERQEGKKAKK